MKSSYAKSVIQRQRTINLTLESGSVTKILVLFLLKFARYKITYIVLKRFKMLYFRRNFTPDNVFWHI